VDPTRGERTARLRSMAEQTKANIAVVSDGRWLTSFGFIVGRLELLVGSLAKANSSLGFPPVSSIAAAQRRSTLPGISVSGLRMTLTTALLP
jgi:hypothetical protein